MLKKGTNNKFWLVLAVLVTVVIGYAGGKKVGLGADTAFEEVQNSNSTENVSQIIEKAAENILSGDFDTANQLIRKVPAKENKKARQISQIIDEYNDLSSKRQQNKAEMYQKQIEEIEKIKQQGTPSDVNEINEAFMTVIKAQENATPEQEKELLESDFVKKLIAEAKKKGEKFEAEGKWVDAYAHCYYWLNKLYPENKDYENHAENLTKLAMIEIALKDNSCDTSRDRHEGITKEMLVRAIRALDFSYVSELDYRQMAKKGVQQCILLAKILSLDNEDISYNVDKDQIARWKAALESILAELNDEKITFEKEDFVRIYGEILALNTLTMKMPEEVIVAQFSEAALEALDPFTNLVWPWKVRDFQKNMTQNFTGIGIHITKLRGVLSVASLLPDTPAYYSGLDANDEILAVNGESTKDMSLNCVVSKITGPKGTKVTLTVRHEDAPEGETEDITLVRDRIVVPTIRGWVRDHKKSPSDDQVAKNPQNKGKWGHMIDPVNKIGYIRLTGFTETTAPAMERQLKSLEERGMKGLIVDLRDNSGGYLATAAAVVDMFIDKGLIVKSQPRWGIATYERATDSKTHPDYPLVILINGSSASASEIVAGALQDEKYNRAILVGSRSYGKGSVQTIVPYSGDGSQLKYTMAYYHLPSDQRVKNRYVMVKQGRKDWGIAPDVEVELTSEEIKKQREIQWSNDVLARADHAQKAKPVKRYSAQETITADPQLHVGLLAVKTKIKQDGGIVKFPEKQSGEKKTVVNKK